MRYKALFSSQGFLGRYWRPGDITADTDEKPPVSKVSGPLFRPLTDEELALVEAKENVRIPGDYGPDRKTLAQLSEELANQGKTGTGVQFNPEKEKELQGKTVDELLVIAAEKGIEVDPKWKKPQIVAAIRKSL